MLYRTILMAILLSLTGCSHSFGFLCAEYSSLYAWRGGGCNSTDNVSFGFPKSTRSSLESKPVQVVAETMTDISLFPSAAADQRSRGVAQGSPSIVDESQIGHEKPVKPLSPITERPGHLAQGINPGTIEVSQIGGEKPATKLEMPLKHTDVNIEVSGFVASVTVKQHYHNPFEKPIEAVYTFPLPNDAAVNDMQMTIGDRTINGLIKRRQEAREIYQRARQQGQRASLLEQERPNIFSQSIANIMPSDQIAITIRYVNILHYAVGNYELVFPMVVGPRYIPGSVAIGHSGTGWASDTNAVPDASRITPPMLTSETRTEHDITLSVALDAGVPIQNVHSPSHQIDFSQINPHQYTIELPSTDQLPNKDFVLRYQVASTAPTMATIAHHDERGGFFTLIIQPQKTVTDEQVVPRELIFILDTSGSMRGFPLAKSKQAMQRLIQGMRSTDRFNVVRFAGDTGTLWAQPQPYTQEHATEALDYVNNFQSRGGTEMDKGIIEALSQQAAPGYLRIALLLTDGYVGNEWTIFQAIEREKRGARVFSLGVGSSVNRYLLERVAELGRGDAFYLRQDEKNSEQVINQFFRRVDRPALAHIEIDWGTLDVTELYPQKIPDLWAGQPIRIHGRYTKGGGDTITVRGQLANQVYEQRLFVELPQNEPAHEAMATVWARQKVRDLINQTVRYGRTKDLVDQITQLGLTYRLMTQSTSLVATDQPMVNINSPLQTVAQPVNLPEGVSDERSLFGNISEGSRQRLNGLFGQVSNRKYGSHMGAIRMPLMATNKAILLPGKKVVVFTWEGGQAPYQVMVTGNGQRWQTETHENLVKVNETDFRFEAGNRYWVTVSYSVKDIRTGKDIRTSIKRKLTVKKTGCSPNYSRQQLIDFDTIPSQCRFEAFQAIMAYRMNSNN